MNWKDLDVAEQMWPILRQYNKIYLEVLGRKTTVRIAYLQARIKPKASRICKMSATHSTIMLSTSKRVSCAQENIFFFLLIKNETLRINKELSLLQHLNPLYSEAIKSLKLNLLYTRLSTIRNALCVTILFGVKSRKGLTKNPQDYLTTHRNNVKN